MDGKSGERGWKGVANRRGGVGRAAAIAALTGRHLSGAVAARACFRSTGADSGPSIGRSSLFLYVWRGVRVRWLPPPSLLSQAKTPYTIPPNSFNYNKQFIRSIQDPPTATHASVWWGIARGVSGRGRMEGGRRGGGGKGDSVALVRFETEIIPSMG